MAIGIPTSSDRKRTFSGPRGSVPLFQGGNAVSTLAPNLPNAEEVLNTHQTMGVIRQEMNADVAKTKILGDIMKDTIQYADNLIYAEDEERISKAMIDRMDMVEQKKIELRQEKTEQGYNAQEYATRVNAATEVIDTQLRNQVNPHTMRAKSLWKSNMTQEAGRDAVSLINETNKMAMTAKVAGLENRELHKLAQIKVAKTKVELDAYLGDLHAINIERVAIKGGSNMEVAAADRTSYYRGLEQYRKGALDEKEAEMANLQNDYKNAVGAVEKAGLRAQMTTLNGEMQVINDQMTEMFVNPKSEADMTPAENAATLVTLEDLDYYYDPAQREAMEKEQIKLGLILSTDLDKLQADEKKAEGDAQDELYGSLVLSGEYSGYETNLYYNSLATEGRVTDLQAAALMSRAESANKAGREAKATTDSIRKSGRRADSSHDKVMLRDWQTNDLPLLQQQVEAEGLEGQAAQQYIQAGKVQMFQEYGRVPQWEIKTQVSLLESTEPVHLAQMSNMVLSYAAADDRMRDQLVDAGLFGPATLIGYSENPVEAVRKYQEFKRKPPEIESVIRSEWSASADDRYEDFNEQTEDAGITFISADQRDQAFILADQQGLIEYSASDRKQDFAVTASSATVLARLNKTVQNGKTVHTLEPTIESEYNADGQPHAWTTYQQELTIGEIAIQHDVDPERVKFVGAPHKKKGQPRQFIIVDDKFNRPFRDPETNDIQVININPGLDEQTQQLIRDDALEIQAAANSREADKRAEEKHQNLSAANKMVLKERLKPIGPAVDYTKETVAQIKNAFIEPAEEFIQYFEDAYDREQELKVERKAKSEARDARVKASRDKRQMNTLWKREVELNKDVDGDGVIGNPGE